MSGGPTPTRLTLRRRQEDALAPVRAALLRDAEAAAGRIRADARRAAELLLTRADADAAGVVSHARAEGEALAGPMAIAEVSHGRQIATQKLLAARLHARAALEERIRTAIADLRDQPGYGELLAGLSELASHVAGPGAVVWEHPAGGALARSRGVLVDCSLPRLAERAIAELGPRIRELSEL